MKILSTVYNGYNFISFHLTIYSIYFEVFGKYIYVVFSEKTSFELEFKKS